MAPPRNKNSNLKNPRNPQSPLFKRLTRLLSGPIVNRRVQMQRRYRRAQLDKFNFTSAGGLNFKRTSYNPYDNLSAQVMANQNRQERYLDFDQMEYMPEIASALDIYADEMTTSTILSPLLKIDFWKTMIWFQNPINTKCVDWCDCFHTFFRIEKYYMDP